MKNVMKKMKEKVETGVITTVITGIITILHLPVNVQAASDLANTKLYTGTIALLGAVSPLLIAVEAAAAGILVALEGMKYQTADDQEKPKHMKNIKVIIGIGIFVMCATGLVPAIFGYYK